MWKPLRRKKPDMHFPTSDQLRFPSKALFLPWLALAVGLLKALALQAQQTDTLTLQDAVAQGLKQNYQIKIARTERAIDRNNVSRGNAGFLPTLRLTADQTNEVNNTRQEFISGETINRTGAKAEALNTRAALQWTLFDGFRMFTTYEQLQHIRKQGEAAFKRVVQEQLSTLIDQYYRLVQLKQQLNTTKEALRLTRKRRSLAKTRMKIGAGSELAYRQAQSDYNADTAAFLRKQQTYQAARIKLNRLMGADIDQEFTVPGSIPLQAGMQFQNLKQKALAQNPDLQVADQEKAIAKQELQTVKGNNYPEIGLNVGYNFSRTASEAGFLSESRQHGLDYGFFLNYDLFDGFNTSRQTDNARIRTQKARLSAEATRRQLTADLRTAFTAYKHSHDRVDLEAANVAVAKQTFELAQTNYQSGGIDYVQLQEAQQTYLEARERLTNARYEAKQAEIRLMRLSGMLINRQADP